MTKIVIPEEKWKQFCAQQLEILNLVKKIKPSPINTVVTKYITAKEFMDAVRIKRTKFDTLVQTMPSALSRKKEKFMYR